MPGGGVSPGWAEQQAHRGPRQDREILVDIRPPFARLWVSVRRTAHRAGPETRHMEYLFITLGGGPVPPVAAMAPSVSGSPVIRGGLERGLEGTRSQGCG